MTNDKKKSKKPLVNSAVVGMAQHEVTQKHGEMASQIIQALKGERYDSSGTDLNHKGRSLKKIGNYKINKNYKTQNIKQQSGFSAELIQESRDNKAAIKSGNPTRTRTTDGIGQGNNQQHDHIKLDMNGNVIEGSGSQMKFLKIDEKGRATVIENLVKDKSYERYGDKIDVPSDQYDATIKYADAEAVKLRETAGNLRERGNSTKANELEDKAQQYEDAKKKIRKSNVTEKEALDARVDPKAFTAKEVLKDVNHAGVEAAKASLILGGGISSAQNIYAVIFEDKPIDDAVVDIAKTTVKTGVVGYTVGAAGATLKATMHSSNKNFVRMLGTSNAPTMIVTGAIQVGASLTRYGKGEISEVELLEELGEKGTGMVAAGLGTAVGGAIGTFVLPGIGTVVGGFAGSMVAYTLSALFYNEALGALKEVKLSAERRAVIEELVDQSIIEMKKYQEALIAHATSEFNKREDALNSFLDGIYHSVINKDIDALFGNVNGIGSVFGLELEFKTFEEFDTAMKDENFKLTF